MNLLTLLALSDDGAPMYDHETAADLAAPAFASTPDLFPDLIAAAIQRRPIAEWAAALALRRRVVRRHRRSASDRVQQHQRQIEESRHAATSTS